METFILTDMLGGSWQHHVVSARSASDVARYAADEWGGDVVTVKRDTFGAVWYVHDDDYGAGPAFASVVPDTVENRYAAGVPLDARPTITVEG